MFVAIAVPTLGLVIPYEQRPMLAIAVDYVAHTSAIAVGDTASLPMAIELPIGVFERLALGDVLTG
jgi:hypothetical protein